MLSIPNLYIILAHRQPNPRNCRAERFFVSLQIFGRPGKSLGELHDSAMNVDCGFYADTGEAHYSASNREE